MGQIKLLLAAVLICGLLTACRTTTTTRVVNPDGSTNVVVVKTADPAKTEKVKAVAEAVTTLALRRALERFPQDADAIALYARAVGTVFCDMQFTKRFDPETLEVGIAALLLPELRDPQVQGYVQDARDVLRVSYRIFWADRFNAELPADKWPAVVASIFCDSIDTALVDSGRPGIKARP